MISIAFDIGGTFANFVLHDLAKGQTQTLKVPTTPGDPSFAVMDGWTDGDDGQGGGRTVSYINDAARDNCCDQRRAGAQGFPNGLTTMSVGKLMLNG